ncbi:MAG: type II toxin-antitoxin system HicB family antitoxin [Patescibacteria group bacterium]
MVRINSKFTAVFKKSGKRYIGWVEEIPGANTQGKTLKEAKENLKEALDMILEANRAHTRQTHHAQHLIRTTISASL